MIKLIINADDFGSSREINRAIIEAFAKGLISSTTIMVNMPGFEDACELAKKNGIQGQIGLHLNLTTGYPLTETIKTRKLFCDAAGKFLRHQKNLFYITPKDKYALREELEAQFNKLVTQGIVPTHIDSHHHSHTKWAIGTEVIRLAIEHKVPSVRLGRNCGTSKNKIKLLYRHIYNHRLKIYGLAKTTNFGSIRDVISLDKLTEILEVMVHPRYCDSGALVDLHKDEDLIYLIHKLLESKPDFELVSFGDIP